MRKYQYQQNASQQTPIQPLTRSPPLTRQRAQQPNQQRQRHNPKENVSRDSAFTAEKPAFEKPNVEPVNVTKPIES